MRKLVIVFLCLFLILLSATSCENNSIPESANEDESEATTLQQQIKEEPSSDNPSNNDPSNDDPSNDDPSNNDPSNDDPSNDDPSNDPGSNTTSSGLGINKDTDSRFGEIFPPQKSGK